MCRVVLILPAAAGLGEYGDMDGDRQDADGKHIVV